jgi:hypothetical protein
MPFAKGQSGNPGGRPKSIDGVNLRELARAHTKDALDTLVAIMADEEAPQPARISAANSILDRGYGKPAQTIGDEDGNSLTWFDLLASAQRRANLTDAPDHDVN